MRSEREAALAALAQSRHGVFTDDDIRELRISTRTARRRRDDGWWAPVMPGVYRLVGTPVTVRMLEEAAVRWLGVDSVRLSHVSAARRWDLSTPPHGKAVITVAHTRRLDPPLGLDVHRTRHFPRALLRDGLPVTPVDRTLVDLAQILSHDDAMAAFTSAIVQRLTTVNHVLCVAGELPHRAGTGLVRRLAYELSPEFESCLELELGRGLRVRGWTYWTPQLRIIDTSGRVLARADFGDPVTRTRLEVDGFAYHGLPEQQQRDKARDRLLARSGWLTLRFGASDIRDRLDQTLDEIGAVRAARLIGNGTVGEEGP
jgi:hypothetical protein